MDSKLSIEPIEKERLIKDLKALGIQEGDLLNIKISMRSIGYVVDGPNTLIDALLETIGPEGTIVSEAFVNVYPLPLISKNVQRISDRYTPSYAGALVNAMLYHPEAFCSIHPIQRFVAIGKHAKELMANHIPESYAYDVLRVMAESGEGHNLKIGTDEKVVGVGTTHVAIGILQLHQNRSRAGLNYYDYKANQIRTFERNWSGGCAVGFNNFIPLYRKRGAILSEGKVGNASSKITDMKKTLEIELEILSKQPAFFFCNNPACKGCQLTWDFSTGSDFSVKLHKIKNKLNALIKAGLRLKFPFP